MNHGRRQHARCLSGRREGRRRRRTGGSSGKGEEGVSSRNGQGALVPNHLGGESSVGGGPPITPTCLLLKQCGTEGGELSPSNGWDRGAIKQDWQDYWIQIFVA